MTEPAPVLTPDSPDWWVALASRAETRRAWALCVWAAFETRTALLLGQGLLTTQEAQAGAWRWVAERLESMPPPPLWGRA